MAACSSMQPSPVLGRSLLFPHPFPRLSIAQPLACPARRRREIPSFVLEPQERDLRAPPAALTLQNAPKLPPDAFLTLQSASPHRSGALLTVKRAPWSSRGAFWSLGDAFG